MAESSSRTGEEAPLNSVLRRNIELRRRERAEEARVATAGERLAESISRFAGRMSFVYLQAVIVVVWVACNVGVPGLPRFDPSFVILATVASVEAIFLSTFILIAQNRAAAAADRRSDLDVHISLLAEHEITRVLDLCIEIARRLDVGAASDPSLGELRAAVEPEGVMHELKEVAESDEP